MNFLVININEHEDDFLPLVIDDVNALDDIKFIGLHCKSDEFILHKDKFIKSRVFFLGYSPLNNDDLGRLVSFIKVSIGNKNIKTFSFYNSSENENVPEDFIFFSDKYMKKSVNYSDFIYSIDELLTFLSAINVLHLKDGLKKIKKQIEYDKLLLRLMNYQFLHCSYGDIRRGIYNSLSNKSFSNNLMSLSREFVRNGGKWLDLNNVLNEYSRYKKNRNERSLILFVGFFCSISSFNKNFLKSALCYSYLLRTVELLSIFYLLKKGYVLENGQKLFFKDGKEVVGAGCLLYYLRDINLIEEDSNIFSLIEIRNNSYLGHGLFSPTLDKYDDIYIEFTNLSRKLLTDIDELNFYIECRDCFSFNKKEVFEKSLSSII